jgi:hypothetical protein
LEDPRRPGEEEVTRYAPGAQVKLFVAGQGSGNFSAINSLEGQGGNTNFFAKVLTTAVPLSSSPTARASLLFLKNPGKTQGKIGLTGLARMLSSGETTPNLRAPAQIYLVPGGSAFSEFAATSDFREEIGKVPAGTLVYQVYASPSISQPKVQSEEDLEATTGENNGLRGDAILIGNIVTTSEFVASEFGDLNLMFANQAFE